MTPATVQQKSHTEVAASRQTQSLGHVYLDINRRQLYCLDNRAKELRNEGIPFTPEDLGKQTLRTIAGQPITAADLPLIQAWKEAHPVEASFILTRDSGALQKVTWTAVPLRDTKLDLIGIIGTVSCGYPEPDWQELAGLAHDLRTPLQALKLLLSLMEGKTLTAEELEEVRKRIQASADRALDIGLELLEWCRRPVQAGMRGSRAWFLLEPFLAEQASEQSASAQLKSLQLITDLSAARNLEVHTDRQRLGRLLSNLLANAVRYTTAGVVEFKVKWRREPQVQELPGTASALVPDALPPGDLIISVEDTGIGISTEEQESIFQPFERGRAGKEGDSGGSGLGLAIVDRLVEELSLTLEVYSEFGRGSTFHLIFPASIIRQSPGPAA
jgi:two-component sensor histidine kinase